MYDLIHDMSGAPELPPETPIAPIFVPKEVLVRNLTLQNISSLTEYDLISTIKMYIDTIANDVLSNNCPYSIAFTHPKFVSALTHYMKSVYVDDIKRLCCNKLIYDYITILESKDKNTISLYLNLGRVVNKDAVAKLMSIGIEENVACNIAVCRFSTTNVQTNVKRLNFVICKQDPDIMTEQQIVWIYEKLFDKFSDLFQGTMFEVYTPEEEEDLGEDFMEIHGRITLAILTILNNMTTDSIRRTLKAYYDEWEYRGKYKVRCSLRRMSADWSRILNVVEELAQMNICKIP